MSKTKTTLYVASLEDWEDDYKRPESNSTQIGIFTSKLAAYRAAWRIEILKNAYMRDFDDIKGNPYSEQLRKLDEIQEGELKALIPKMEKYRENYLGEPEFTMQSSGQRCTVTELIVDKVSCNRKELRKLERSFLEEMDRKEDEDDKRQDDKSEDDEDEEDDDEDDEDDE